MKRENTKSEEEKREHGKSQLNQKIDTIKRKKRREKGLKKTAGGGKNAHKTRKGEVRWGGGKVLNTKEKGQG